MTPPTDTQSTQQPEQPKKWLTIADLAGSMKQGRGPDCIWCNAPTQKTGTCFTCVACGETTGCG